MPGVRVTSVRRTVRVAVALVVAQALLGGIIGFVTFGRQDGAASGARSAEPQLAGPPIVVPTVIPGPSGRAGRSKSAVARETRTQLPAAPPTSAPARGAATPATTASPGPAAPPAPPPAPSTSPTNHALLPPSPVPAGDEPIPVVAERCDDEGATGRTADGKAVRCERDRNGDLRWRLV